ncbi:hypothetical protein [Albibacterium indicum]|uniref:hypothetical protein n=1 Tax=Albibacterium indicum TaxID=2292082 RepID=UPI000E480226|nr:hypothetical protein [Pedobacter indicus]
MAKQKTGGSQHVLHYRKKSIEKQLENHIKEIEKEILVLQEKLDVAKQHHKNYLEHKDTIETILTLLEESKPTRRSYKNKTD